MGELDAEFAALSMDKVGNALQARDLLVLPNTSVRGGDASLRDDSSGFGQDQSSAQGSEGTEVDEVVVGEEAVSRGEHAHGGDNESVGDGQVLDCVGLEDEGDLVSIGLGGIDGSEV